MKNNLAKPSRCEIYAGGTRVRSFPDDRALEIVKAHKRGSALVLVCRAASGELVEVETTLRYLLIRPVVPAAMNESTREEILEPAVALQ